MHKRGYFCVKCVFATQTHDIPQQTDIFGIIIYGGDELYQNLIKIQLILMQNLNIRCVEISLGKFNKKGGCSCIKSIS